MLTVKSEPYACLASDVWRCMSRYLMLYIDFYTLVLLPRLVFEVVWILPELSILILLLFNFRCTLHLTLANFSIDGSTMAPASSSTHQFSHGLLCTSLGLNHGTNDSWYKKVRLRIWSHRHYLLLASARMRGVHATRSERKSGVSCYINPEAVY